MYANDHGVTNIKDLDIAGLNKLQRGALYYLLKGKALLDQGAEV